MDETRSSWDHTLVVATVALLGALGAQSLLGTLYAWVAYRTDPAWETTGYPGFVGAMNAVAGPLVIALVVVMGLCVPKRLFARTTLVGVSAAMLVAGVATWAFSGELATGLAVYLTAAALLQLAVVVAVLAGTELRFSHAQARASKVGSGLLHLGFVLFALVVVALQDSALMLPVFFAAAAMLVGGSALSFYASAMRKPSPAEE